VVSFDGFRKTVVRERFERIADSYDDTIVRRRAAYNDAVDALVARHAPAPRDRPVRLLDAACGTGARWQHLHALLPHVQAWGLDASENMCDLARRRGEFVEVTRADLTRMPYPDGHFDMVTCLFFSLCYLTCGPARLAALREMRRVLRPGGLLAVDVINVWHLGEGLQYRRSRLAVAGDIARSWLDPRLRPGDKLYRTPYGRESLRGYFHGFTHRSFRSLLRAARLPDRQLCTVGYNSGRIHQDPRSGQILALVRR
jgi:ubiquinone/menaquinone biosynthesis C-methylase UbiE